MHARTAFWILIVSLVLAANLEGAQAPAGEITLVAFGDSTTAERKGVDRVYARRLSDLLVALDIKARVINAGVGGDTTARARERLERDVIAPDPEVVILQFGLNDAAVDVFAGKTGPRCPLPEYEKNLADMVRTCKRRAMRVILMTPNPARWTEALKARYGKKPYDPEDPEGFDILVKDYAAAVRRIAEAEHVDLVDVHALFAAQDARTDAPLLLDGLHPTDRGHALIAAELAARIARMAPLPPRGFSIPLIDLDADTDRQVVVDREPGQYLGHPTTVLLEDGKTLLCVYPKGHGRGAIVMKKSLDGGRTWSERLPTPASWATSKEVPTIHRVIDAEGTKRLILFSGLHPIRMAVSEDDGSTWSELIPIGDYGGIVTMGCVERLKDGTYLALFHDDGRFLRAEGKRTNLMHVFKVLSRDGGLTWSQPEVIAHDPAVHLCEPGIIRSPDGKRLAVLLRENSRTRNGFILFSDDEGVTWSRPRELPGALTGDRHTGKYGPDGRLFISFRDTCHRSPTQGDWAGWVGTFADLEQGREGQYRVRLKDNRHRWDCAYPGVEVLPDGTFVTTTYGHWIEGEKPYVLSVRFTLTELDAKAEALKARAGGKPERDP